MGSALLTLAFQSVQGQSASRDTLEYRYPEVLVTAPRMSLPLREIPFATSVVGPYVLGALPRGIGFDEAVTLVPGIKVDNQANGSRVHVSIRGQGILTERGIRGIKILLDGIPLNDPSGFVPDLFDVDFSTVDRIEVLRGPSASMYGGSASGGIVNILTSPGPGVPLSGRASLEGGTNGFWKGLAEVGGEVKAMNYRVSFSRSTGDGFREHTHFRLNNLYGKATYALSDGIHLTPIVARSEAFHENPEGITLLQVRKDAHQANPDAIPYNEYLSSNRTTIGLTGDVELNRNSDVTFSASTKRTLFTEANNRTFNHRTLTTPGFSMQYTLRMGERRDELRNRISVGIDAQWQTIDEYRVDNLFGVEGDTLRSKEQIRQASTGVFLIEKLDIGTRWGVMASFRYDDIRNELEDLLRIPDDLSGSAGFSRSTLRVGFTYTPAQEVTMYGSWGQGFLPPATEELAQNPDHFGGFNAHLAPATSEGFELGVRHTMSSTFRYELTGFFLSTQNDFDRYRISDPLRNQETFYRNAASSKRNGAEVYLEYLSGRTLDVQAAYTLSVFQYTNAVPVQVLMDDPAIRKYVVSGNWLPNSPKHQLAVDVRYLIAPGYSAGLTTESLSKTYIDGANVEAEATDGYTLVHFRVNHDWQLAGIRGEFSFQIRNLTDKQYIAFTEPDPGGNAYQPGTRREVFVGVKVRM